MSKEVNFVFEKNVYTINAIVLFHFPYSFRQTILQKSEMAIEIKKYHFKILCFFFNLSECFSRNYTLYKKIFYFIVSFIIANAQNVYHCLLNSDIDDSQTLNEYF